ncbi:MAG: aminotransferase class V-fold PLP-dependent enzyme [Candidatus Nanohaloarchaeota archaeon]|nr:aminotransferase class V-fold PLP-dependent enzyme [Candidatus Nanohaloarchaeota archaeon]
MFEIIRPQGIYFDNAATSLMPKEVLDVLQKYYTCKRSNIGRGMHKLGINATFKVEEVREKLMNYFNADDFYVFFVFNSTFASNISALSYRGKMNSIAFSVLEHNSAYLPWFRVAKQNNANIHYLELDAHYDVIYEGYYDVAVISHASNVIGKVNHVKRIADLMVVDGAQIVGHREINLNQSHIDVFYFSAHKCLGPYGAGALFIRKDKFEMFESAYLGGGSVKYVDRERFVLKQPPHSWESGTPAIAEIIAMGKALDLINENIDYIKTQEKQLIKRMLEVMEELGLEHYGEKDKQLPIFAFNVPGIKYLKVAELLNQHNIYVRAGHHCAHLLMDYLGIEGCVRASLHFYNTLDEINAFNEVLKKVKA